MSFFYKEASHLQLLDYHYQITSLMILTWFLFSYLGNTLKSENNIHKISIALLGLSVGQEIFDYMNRITNELYYGGGLSVTRDIPLHLCHFSYWLSVLTLFIVITKKFESIKQLSFNLSYFFGFSGALMGIITVSLEGIFTFGDILYLNLQHSLIILNVLWLIFAYKFKFSFNGIIQSFIFINIAALIVGLINILIGPDANYMFLCKAPEVNNPLLFGGVWPYYIIGFEFIFFIYGLILLFPFKITKYLKNDYLL